MKAAVLREFNQYLSVEEIELEEPKEGEVKIRYGASGICHSDLTRLQGKRPTPLPIVLGHEAAGEIIAVGKGVKDLNPGDHVVVIFRYCCGQCEICKSGFSHLCSVGKEMRNRGTMQDGTTRMFKANEKIHQLVVSSFCEYGIVPASCAVKIPLDIPFECAALLGCAILTGTGAVFNTAKVAPGSSVLIIGCGGVGLNVIQAARISGASKIIAADIDPSKLELALEFGATHVVNSRTDNLVKRTKELTNQFGADFAFEAIGNPQTILGAYESVHEGGMVVVIGLADAEVRVQLNALSIMRDEKILTGSSYGGMRSNNDLHRLVDFYQNKQLVIDKLIAKQFDLKDINHAIHDLENGVLGRNVILYS